MSTLSAAIHATVYRGGGDPSLIFDAPLRTTLTPARASTPGFTFSTDTTAGDMSVIDGAGRLQYCARNEPRFLGARRVENLCLQPLLEGHIAGGNITYTADSPGSLECRVAFGVCPVTGLPYAEFTYTNLTGSTMYPAITFCTDNTNWRRIDIKAYRDWFILSAEVAAEAGTTGSQAGIYLTRRTAAGGFVDEPGAYLQPTLTHWPLGVASGLKRMAYVAPVCTNSTVAKGEFKILNKVVAGDWLKIRVGRAQIERGLGPYSASAPPSEIVDVNSSLGPELCTINDDWSGGAITDWTPYGPNTVVNDNGAIKITYVNAAEGAYLYLRQSSGVLNADLKPGSWYRVTYEAKTNSATSITKARYFDTTWTCQSLVGFKEGYVSTSGDWFRVALIIYCDGALPLINFQSLGAGEILWVRNLSVKEINSGLIWPTVKNFEGAHGNTLSGLVVTEASGAQYSATTVKGYLSEPESTNLITYATPTLPGVAWWATLATMTEYNASAPDGSQWGVLVVDNSTSGQHKVEAQTTLATPGRYSVSVFVKQPSSNPIPAVRLAVWNGTDSTWVGVDFTFATKTVTRTYGISGTEFYEELADGWYRIGVSGTLTTGGLVNQVIVHLMDGTIPYAGTGKGLFVFGAQLEAHPCPTSLIHTFGAATTRTKTNLDYPWACISGINAEGALAAEFSHIYQGTIPDTRGMLSTGANGRLLYSSDGAGNCLTYDGTNAHSHHGGPSTRNLIRKMASSWKTTKSTAHNGAMVVTGGVFDGSNLDMAYARFVVGSLTLFSATDITCGAIRNIKLWNAEKPASFLQAITT